MSEMYTQRLLDHYRHPRNEGHLDQPDLSAEVYNPLCGDRVRIEARVVEGRISEICFTGRGCALCLGAASILTEALRGRRLEDLRDAEEGWFLEELQAPIRSARRRCALLPWEAFRCAAFGADTGPGWDEFGSAF